MRITSKSVLLRLFSDAIRMGGWDALQLSPPGSHPAIFRLFREDRRLTVRVYIWNITHGGKGRASSEYRIQVTGAGTKLVRSPDANTVILGWSEDADSFGAWDIRQHLKPLGRSPSMQIAEDTLHKAAATGFAASKNSKGETVLGIRPDFMATYLEFIEELHTSGTIPAEANVLERIAADPDKVKDKEIEDSIAAGRRHALVTTKKALRAGDFAKRVLGAYGHRCAMCGVQLRLLDAAHILPVSEPKSTDATSNGIALCAQHHRAYDAGLVTFTPKYKVLVSKIAMKLLKDADRHGGETAFRAALNPSIIVPVAVKERPKPAFVHEGNILRGWTGAGI